MNKINGARINVGSHALMLIGNKQYYNFAMTINLNQIHAFFYFTKYINCITTSLSCGEDFQLMFVLYSHLSLLSSVNTTP